MKMEGRKFADQVNDYQLISLNGQQNECGTLDGSNTASAVVLVDWRLISDPWCPTEVIFLKQNRSQTE
jgi:hypothetical protein